LEQFFNFRLRNAPTPVKALALGYILALSLAYVYAIGNIAMVVGLSPKDIMVHYYGAEKTIEVAPKAAGEEEFSLDDAPAAAPMAELGPRPSFKNLVAAGHFHLFGMSSFFFGLTLLGLFTSLKTNVKTLLVFIPFVAVIFDNLSFLATRFLGPAFAYLTAISGAFMGLTFAALWFAVLYEVLQKREVK
jgi:hypothetical protein